MTRRKNMRSGLAAAASCALAFLVAGCGSDEEKGKGIPPQSAQALEQQLDSIQNRVDADACRDVTEGDETNVDSVEQAINQLPSDTDPDVRDALEQGFQRLFDLVEQECQPETNTQTETTPTETIPPQTTPTETTPTETTPTETTPTETTPPATKPKKPKQNPGGGGSPSPPTGGGTPAPGDG